MNNLINLLKEFNNLKNANADVKKDIKALLIFLNNNI